MPEMNDEEFAARLRVLDGRHEQFLVELEKSDQRLAETRREFDAKLAESERASDTKLARSARASDKKLATSERASA